MRCFKNNILFLGVYKYLILVYNKKSYSEGGDTSVGVRASS